MAVVEDDDVERAALALLDRRVALELPRQRRHRERAREERAQPRLRLADELVHHLGPAHERRRPRREARREPRREQRLAAAGWAVEQQPLDAARAELREQLRPRQQLRPPRLVQRQLPVPLLEARIDTLGG